MRQRVCVLHVYALVRYSRCVGGWVYNFFSDARKSECNSSSRRHVVVITSIKLLLIAASAIGLALLKCLWYLSSQKKLLVLKLSNAQMIASAPQLYCSPLCLSV